MLSSRYYQDSMEFFRRSERGGRFALSQHSPVDQYEADSQLSRRTTPSTETEKSAAPSRKRVPVACERCRKRKIKCSGDEGGTCMNCRNTGHACAFMRVSSLPFTPYMIRTHPSRGAWHGGERWQPYAHPSAYRQNYPTSNSAYGQPIQACQGLHAAMECSPYQPTPSQSSWSRANSYSSYSPYESEATGSYSTQPPDYMLPDTNPMTQHNTYLGYSHSHKPHSAYVWSEQPIQVAPQSAAQLTPSAYPDPVLLSGSSASYVSGPTRNDHFPPLLNTTAGSLITDRTLPNPSTKAYSAATALSYDAHPTSAVSQRSSVTWSGTEASSSSSQVSSHTSVSSGSADVSQEYIAEHRQVHRGSQDLGLQNLAYATGPQAPASSDTIPISNADTSVRQHHVSSSMTEPGIHRCRTVSQDDIRALIAANTSPPSHSYANGPAFPRSHATADSSTAPSNDLAYARAQYDSAVQRDNPSNAYEHGSNSYRPSGIRASVTSINSGSGSHYVSQ